MQDEERERIAGGGPRNGPFRLVLARNEGESLSPSTHLGRSVLCLSGIPRTHQHNNLKDAALSRCGPSELPAASAFPLAHLHCSTVWTKTEGDGRRVSSIVADLTYIPGVNQVMEADGPVPIPIGFTIRLSELISFFLVYTQSTTPARIPYQKDHDKAAVLVKFSKFSRLWLIVKQLGA